MRLSTYNILITTENKNVKAMLCLANDNLKACKRFI